MTDNEIIKALECCTTNGASCKDCPAFVKVDRSNCKKYFRGAIDLINRLQAENERLSKITRPLIAEIKAEAYKQCIEKVKNYIKTHCNPYGKPDFDYDTSIRILNFINNLAKEMVGDDNA